MDYIQTLEESYLRAPVPQQELREGFLMNGLCEVDENF